MHLGDVRGHTMGNFCTRVRNKEVEEIELSQRK